MYVGQMESAEGVKPDPDKAKAIGEYPQPKTKEDLRCFLGIANYLDEFISSIADVSEPLRVLLKNDRMALLQDIKRLLTNAPVLKLFDSHKEVVIETDISKDGLCAFLLQVDHPLAYDSKS